MTKGMFITVEGVEGVGKSTNIDFIAERISAAGFEVLRSREPGGTPMAERIRSMLLEHGDEPLPDLVELLLFFASRTLNIENVIRPALASGKWVLCDRFTDSSRAYQGAGRGQGIERVNILADWAHGDLNPDLTVLLDAPAEVGMRRAKNRGATDRLESEQMSFYTRVREQYLALAKGEPERFAVIDASLPLVDVRSQIGTVIDALLESSK